MAEDLLVPVLLAASRDQQHGGERSPAFRESEGTAQSDSVGHVVQRHLLGFIRKRRDRCLRPPHLDGRSSLEHEGEGGAALAPFPLHLSRGLVEVPLEEPLRCFYLDADGLSGQTHSAARDALRALVGRIHGSAPLSLTRRDDREDDPKLGGAHVERSRPRARNICKCRGLAGAGEERNREEDQGTRSVHGQMYDTWAAHLKSPTTSKSSKIR